MKKWAIVNTRGKVLNIYEAEEPISFGGPWGDPMQTEHLCVPEALKEKTMDEVEARFEDVQIGCQGQPLIENGAAVKEKVFDNDGNPITGADGHQLEVDVYEEVPVMANKRVIVLKD